MARIRSIKPAFFRHEGIQALEKNNPGLYTMLVFAGLWTVSDRAGRFEWRPNVLKLDILPFLDFSMEKTLHVLQEAGFIVWYEVEGKQYGHIPSWDRHQKGESLKNEDIRCPDPENGESDLLGPIPGQIPDKSGNAPGQIREGIRNGNGNKEREEELSNRVSWRTDFKIYEKEVSDAFDAIIKNPSWISDRQRYHPGLDIRITLEKSFNDFWGTEAGWKHKKAKHSKTIDWDATFKNALTLKGNQVWLKRK